MNILLRRLSSWSLTSNSSVEIKLSENCVRRLKEIFRGPNSKLRVLVESGGCSGFQYKFQIEETSSPKDDQIIERDGVQVIVDKDSFELLKGSTIDYHEELIKSSFRIVNNPNAEQGCSCGTSFSIK